MATYCSVDDVAAELGGVSLTASTTPTSTTVSGWIDDAEAEIDLLAGTIFTTSAITTSAYEYSDYDGSGVIKFENYPLISVESIEYEENGLGNASESWVALTEGRTSTGNYIVYPELGVAKLHANSTGNNPTVGYRNIRTTYTYGRATVPNTVKHLCAKMAAKRYLDSVASKTGTSEGGSITIGAISINDPTNYAITRVKALNDEIDMLQKKVVGDFKTHTYNTRLFE
jgi:hypothetical protein